MSDAVVRLKPNTLLKLSRPLKIIFFFLLIQSSIFYGKEIVVGMINDNPHFYYPSHNSTMKRQKTDVINLLKRELKNNLKMTPLSFVTLTTTIVIFLKHLKVLKDRLKQ